MQVRTEIGSAEARELLATVVARLEREDLAAAVAVVDPHGELLAFARTDGCPLPSIKISIGKAFTAARQRMESRAVGDQARDEDFPLTNFAELGYVGWGGGVPIVVDGALVGAIGISGLPEEVDMELARWAAGSVSGG
jgi:glc operon protein GlcG